MPKFKRRSVKPTANSRNVYRVRTGWYLQLQWAGHVYRELFSDSKYGGRAGALIKATANRDWLNKYREEFEIAVAAMARASDAQDVKAYEHAVFVLTTTIGKKLGRRDRAIYDEYFATERGYVPAK